MKDFAVGIRSSEVRRSRLAGAITNDLEGGEKFGHRRGSKLLRDYGKSGEGEGKYHKSRNVSRQLALLLVLGALAAVATLALSGFSDDSEEADDVTSVERAAEGLIPGCRPSSSLWTGNIIRLVSGPSYTHCYLPQGASIVSRMRTQYPHQGPLAIGLVNVGLEDGLKWDLITKGWGRVHRFPFRSVSPLKLKWEDLYPEWIDEEEVSETPKCPHLPLPKVQKGVALDVVVARVPGVCGSEPGRDLRRLQIYLAAATVASKSQSMGIVIISKCRPPLNILTCSDLLERRGNVWFYQVDYEQLKNRLAVPVGSCELAMAVDLGPAANCCSAPKEEAADVLSFARIRREAYATILHSDGIYVCGAIVMGHSIKQTGSQRDLVALVDSHITPEQRNGLKQAGWKLHLIERIKNPRSDPLKYNAWNYSKFRLWQLTQYEKIVFIDADLLVLRNLDFLFDLPQLSATGNDKHIFNSGVMVVEPSNCTFNILMEQIDTVTSYNGGDQGYLNEIFPWWHRIPKRVNYLKHFWSSSTEEREIEYHDKNQLFQADPPILYVIHYLGRKPWLCFRDYDCNWNTDEAQMYASDEGHALWWKVHDSMAPELQEQCLLSTKMKAKLEWERREAEAAVYRDRHWERNITDPRLQICHQSFCYWESMLWHWGENRTETLSEAQRKP